MPNIWVRINTPVMVLWIALTVFPPVAFGQDTIRYDTEIRTKKPVRYGSQITEKPPKSYSVDIGADDIRQVPSGEIVPEEVSNAFKFDIRNYIKLTGYHDDLGNDSIVNPDNILESEENGVIGEVNTQIKLSYLMDYQFKADVGYQISSGSGEQEDQNTHFMTNEFYFDFFLAKMAYLKLGKKRQTLGVGWTFSPVDDVFEWPKNPVDPSDFREGKYLAAAEIPYGDASFNFLILPDVEYDLETEQGQSGIPQEMDFSDPTLAVQILLLLWDTDVALIYKRTDKIPELNKDYYGLTINRYWGDLGVYFELIGHKGNDLEFVQIDNTGNYYFPSGEALESLKNDDDEIFMNFSVGLNYSLADGTKFSLEYFRNNEGYDDDEFDEFYDFLKNDSDLFLSTADDSLKNKILKANQIMGDRIRQNYLSLTFDRPYTFDDFNPHLGTIINMDDGSFLLNGALEYAVRDNTSITLDMRWFVGDDDTEYGLKADTFKAVLKAIYYF